MLRAFGAAITRATLALAFLSDEPLALFPFPLAASALFFFPFALLTFFLVAHSGLPRITAATIQGHKSVANGVEGRPVLPRQRCDVQSMLVRGRGASRLRADAVSSLLRQATGPWS